MTNLDAPIRPVRRRPSTLALVVAGLLVSALLAGVVSFYASRSPDGLNSVAQSLGFHQAERTSVTAGSPLAGYSVSDVADPRLSGGLAGLVGVAVVGLLMTGVVLLLRRRRGPSDPDA